MIIICRHCRISLSAYLENELDEHRKRLLREHLFGCIECTIVLETFRKTIMLCRDLPPIPVPEELHSRIMLLLEREFQPEPPAKRRKRESKKMKLKKYVR